MISKNAQSIVLLVLAVVGAIAVISAFSMWLMPWTMMSGTAMRGTCMMGGSPVALLMLALIVAAIVFYSFCRKPLRRAACGCDPDYEVHEEHENSS